MSEEFLQKIPSHEILRQRFAFIDNETLRGNVTIYFRYIIFLLAISEEEELDSIVYSTYKDIIIFTASIVESILEYSVSKHILQGKASKDVYGWSYKTIEVGTIRHECTDLYKSSLKVIKKSKLYKLESGDEITFNDINKAAKNAGILDDSLYAKADELRNKRNTIHLSSLNKSSDDYFKKSDVEKAFKNAHDIILKVESLFAIK